MGSLGSVPEGEGPLLVAAQPAAVDGGGAGDGVQVVGAVGEGGDPLAVPLALLLPKTHIFSRGRTILGRWSTSIGRGRTIIGRWNTRIGRGRTILGRWSTRIGRGRTILGRWSTSIGRGRTILGSVLPKVCWWFCADRYSFVLLIVSFKDLFYFRCLQQGDAGGQ